MASATSHSDDHMNLLSSASGAAAPPGGCSEQSRMPLGCALRALTACVWRAACLLVSGRVHQPETLLGRRIHFADGTSGVVYRETIIDGPPPTAPAVLVVCFRLRHIRRRWAHTLFRWESELNTILFAGFPGLVSKLWLTHDQCDRYRGFYQWDDRELAVAYVRALWWVLALVSAPGSIHYAVLPELDRDEILTDPAVIDAGLRTATGGWWRPAKRDQADR